MTKSTLLRVLFCSLTCVAGMALWALATRQLTKSLVGVRDYARNARTDPQTSCGPVALAEAADILGSPVSIAQFHEATRAGEAGACSMADLQRALREHGFSSAAVRYAPPGHPRHALPTILLIDGAHFLVALPSRGDQFVLLDPPAEPVAANWSELGERWRGEALVVGRSATEVENAIREE